MTRKFTFMILAMLFAILGPGAEAWGQETTVVASYSRSGTTNTTTGGTFSQNLSSKTGYYQDNSTSQTYYMQLKNANAYWTNTPNSISFTANLGGGTTKDPLGDGRMYVVLLDDNGNEITSTVTEVTNKITSTTGSEFTVSITPTQNVYGVKLYHSKIPSYNVRYYSMSLSYIAGGTTPTVAATPTSIDLGNVNINEEAEATFTVHQANLTNDISLSADNGNLDITNIVAGANDTEVTYTFTPTASGEISDVITISCDDLEEDITINVTGTAVDPSQVDTYELFTGDLVEGDYVIYYGGKAMKNTVTSSRLDYSEVSPVNNAIANPDAAIVWHIAQSGDYWTIFNAAVEKYAAGNGTKNQATLLTDGTDNGSLWTVSGTETHDFTNKKNTSSNVNATLRNNGTYGFACYATGTGGALTLYKKAENKAATPTLTESQTFTTKPFNVTITNNEAGATVYYTTDGNDPTTETTTNFTGESKTIEINTTTTVKAMAVVEGKANSEIASATYTEQKNDPENQWSAEAYTATIGGENTFPTFLTQSDGAVTYTSSNTNAATIDNTGVITLVAVGTTTITASTTETATYMAGEASYTLTVKEAPLATMDAIFAKATAVGSTATNVEITFSNWVISGVKGSNAYLTDNAGKGLIIYTSDHGFAVGDVLNGTIACQIKLYSGASELMGVTSETSGLTVTKNGEITIHEVSIAALSGVNTGAVIIASNVIYTGSDNVFSDGENTIKAYYTFMTLPSFTNGDSYNLTGVYIQYNTTKEIAPRSAADIQLIVAAPTFTPEGGDYNAAQNVEIASATTGATIYYTLDGSDPTVESTLYSAPIELTSNTTLKAIAAKAGSVSEIATAVYTITITTVATPTFEPEDGSYFDEDLKVSLACATDGATIVYTTDNWATQKNYTAPFTITETTTVKAKATKAAMDDSEIAEATYTKRYKVDYVVNGDATAIASVYVTPGEAIGTLPTPGAENIPTGFDFAGWSSSESSTTTIVETYIVNANVTLYAVFSREEGGTPGSGNYEKVTSLSDIVAGKYIITATKDGTEYTMKNDKVSAKYLVAYSLESQNLSVENNAIVGNAINNSWTFTGTNNSMTITSTKETQTCYLYATNTNNGMVVGSTSDTWSFTAVDNTDLFYMKDSNQNRYLSLYDSQDWRCYINTNNGVPKLALYKKDEGTPGNTKYYTRVQSISGNTEITTVTTADLITVPNGAVLTITGSCTGDPENLIIEDGGQLIVNNSVQATMKKHIENTPSRDDQARSWYTISSPLAAENTAFAYVTNLIPGSVTDTDYDLYRFDEENGMWINSRIYDTDGTTVIENENFKTIDKGVGYIYSNAATTNIAFKGEVNVADVKCTLTNDAAHGFNLIGNPFTQNIKLTDVKSDGTAVLADGFYVLNNDETWGTEPITTGTIAPLQGFLVQVDGETGGTATIEKPAAPSKGERSNEQNTSIEVIVSNSNYRDNAYAMFGEGIGLNKVNHRNAQAPMLYIPQDGENFAIAFMDENTTIFPLSFKAMTTGSYSISLKATDDISTLVLVDNMTGTETNMLLEDSYTFIGSPRDSENRFTVKLKISNSQEENEHFAYQNGNELVINGEGTLQIFDVLGRVVVSEEVHGQTVNVGGLNTGAYIARLTGESVKTQKIVVR